MEALDLLANNISNAATTGYKADRESYRQFISELQDATEGSYALPVVERQWTDHAQGALQNTERALDVAIEGQGFFALTSGKQTLLTRNGSFHLSSEGELQSEDGSAVRKRGGGTFRLDAKQAVTISPEGEVTQNGKSQGFLDIVSLKDPSLLVKQKASVFVPPSEQPAMLFAVNGKVAQGKLETSNSNPSDAAVKMVEVLREFETLQRAASMGTEMNKKAIEEVARVAS